MRLPRLIGVAGPAGAGKDTVADALVGQHGYSRRPLAMNMKAAINVMCGFKMSDWQDREWKETVIPELGKSPREMAQTLGTQWGRGMVHEDIWINSVMAEWFEMNRGNFTMVIPDIRFQNEIDAVSKAGGVILFITRPDAAKVALHESETQPLKGWPGQSCQVANHGTILDLQSVAIGMLSVVAEGAGIET